jgi:hypothetical protein
VKIVVIESPYRPSEVDPFKNPARWLEVLRRNVKYARAAYRYCLVHCGVAPYASHLNFAQPGVLDDQVEEERWLGIEAGLAIARKVAEESWFFVDLGQSDGMTYGEADADECDRPKKFIELGPDWETKWLGPTRNRPI